MKYFKRLAHHMFRLSGYDFLRYTPENFVSLRRAQILHAHNVNLVLDVGASEGTYAKELREAGYSGRIISFEPLLQSFSFLKRCSASDPLWNCENLAIGDSDGVIEMNVSGHKTSSSILPLAKAHIQAMPASAIVGKEKVTIAQLNSLSDKLFKPDDRIYLKIDVQGYEKHVLQSAEKVLKQAVVIELELSLTPVYEGGTLINEMFDFLTISGFKLASLEHVFSDPLTGNVLQVDGIFVK